MRDDRVLRVLRPSLALAALAAMLVVLGLAIAGPAHAATKSPKPEATKTAKAAAAGTATPSPTSTGAIVLQRGTEVRFGENVLVAKGTTVPSVVVFGGDIVVNGRVTDAVVAFGGNVTINGTVGTSVVVFGGDVKLGPKAVVGKDMKPTDASLVLFGGDLTQAPGAQIIGQTKSFTGLNWSDALGWAGRGMFFSPFVGFSFFGWVVQTAFFLVLALVAAALMPHQLRGVQQQLGRSPWASLGWGALAFFIAGPAILIVLVISIIGLLLVLPYVLFVVLAYFFVTTAVGAFLAQKVLTGFGGRENLMLAVVIGVVGTTVVSRIPVIGPLLLAAMMIIGAGAAILGGRVAPRAAGSGRGPGGHRRSRDRGRRRDHRHDGARAGVHHHADRADGAGAADACPRVRHERRGRPRSGDAGGFRRAGRGAGGSDGADDRGAGSVDSSGRARARDNGRAGAGGGGAGSAGGERCGHLAAG